MYVCGKGPLLKEKRYYREGEKQGQQKQNKDCGSRNSAGWQLSQYIFIGR